MTYMPVYRLNPDEVSFPNPMYARRDGLLAVGGDLSVERLLLAYTHGIFPWYDPGEEILWDARHAGLWTVCSGRRKKRTAYPGFG